MRTRHALGLFVVSLVAVTACSPTTDDAVVVPGVGNGGAGSGAEPPTPDASSDPEPATAPNSDAAPATTDAPTTTSPTTSTASTTTESSTTTTTTPTTEPESSEPESEVFDAACVYEVTPGDSLGLIADLYDDDTISIAAIRAENALDDDTIFAGQVLDVCVDNGLDDVTGSERTERNAAIVAEETAVAVRAQQEQLNELLTPYGMRELKVDGISGPVTRRHLCAARLGLGLDVTLTDMEPGSDEEAALMEATGIVAPFTSALNSDRWILIDRTCQVMFVGQGAESLDFVFPTSTGEQGYETRDQDRSRVFRYDPALQNDGWHNSTTFPVEVDNPLNGNMYRPLYFDGGQAIHGANNVPTTPQSKGCARLSPSNQDRLVTWLGLKDATGPRGGPGVTVNVQGAYPHP